MQRLPSSRARKRLKKGEKFHKSLKVCGILGKKEPLRGGGVRKG
jgi:hypothetical protein